ncbi:hypothetical protein [Actinacidiphila alni]|uniref:hypothetical protein n=1 Tax=Actinacidiphila alni TaxID=380248 RepID=UPI003455EB99
MALSDFYNAGSLAGQWGCSSYDVNPVTLQNRVLDFARARSKPVMIAEASPQGYSTSALTKSRIMKKSPQPTTATALWNDWYSGYWSWIEQNADVIRVAAYINTDWDSQTGWQCADGASASGPGCSNGYWGDARIQANATVRDNFLTELRKCVFVGGTTGACGGGTTPPTAPPTTPPTTPPAGAFTQGVTTGQAGHDTLWFTPNASTCTFVAVHYTLDGGGQLNYMMTFNATTGRWEQPVTVPAGHTLAYWFDYQPTGQTYQNTTAHYSFTG